MLGREKVEEWVLWLGIAVRCLIRLLFDEASEVVVHNWLLLHLWLLFLLHEGELFSGHLRLFLAEKLTLTVEQLDLLLAVVAWHREENWVLEAEGGFGDETLLLWLLLFYHGSLRPDLVDGPGALRQVTLHSAKDHILLLLGLIRARRILLLMISLFTLRALTIRE